MPTGVPVASMGINNSRNAAILAAQILELNDPTLEQNLKQYDKKEENRGLSALDESLDPVQRLF